MKHEKSLKLLARIAKKRLKNQEEHPVPTAKNSIETEEDEILTNKIMEILKSNYDTPAPLMQLIDKNKFEKLCPLEREIYIFNLIEKYNFYRDWYGENKQKAQ
jgi:hypothetical protein